MHACRNRRHVVWLWPLLPIGGCSTYRSVRFNPATKAIDDPDERKDTRLATKGTRSRLDRASWPLAGGCLRNRHSGVWSDSCTGVIMKCGSAVFVEGGRHLSTIPARRDGRLGSQCVLAGENRGSVRDPLFPKAPGRIMFGVVSLLAFPRSSPVLRLPHRSVGAGRVPS